MFYLVKEEDKLHETKYDLSIHDNFNNTNEEIDIPSMNFLNWMGTVKIFF